jgi:ribonuclease-3
LFLNPSSSIDLPSIDAERKKVLLSFQKSLSIGFKNLELLNLSVTHRSVSNEADNRSNNERLEFLGDAILGAVTASLLYGMLDKQEGELAKIKSVVVSEDILSGLAREIQIDSILLLGRGEELTGGRNKSAILADAFEALIGAFCLDSGYNAAFDFVSRYMRTEINRVLSNEHYQDYKSLLQELSQHLFKAYPIYHLIKRSGPDHERLFWMEVTVNGRAFGPAIGRSKKTAEQEAARMAYEAISSPKPNPA